jgi:predicted nucleic acid-binding protein
LNRVVLDASAAIGLLVESQSTPAVEAMRGQGHVLLAPAVFSLEVRHAVLRLERRGILAMAAIDSDLDVLETLIRFEPAPGTAEARGVILAHARRYALGASDAANLELALRRPAPLASRDSALIAAAQQAQCAVTDFWVMANCRRSSPDRPTR